MLSGATIGNAVPTALADFFARESMFRGGVQVGTGDLDGDGLAEVWTGARPGGGPVVKAFARAGTALRAFFAGDASSRGGVSVAGFGTAAGRPAEVFAAAAGQVRVYDGSGTQLRPCRAFDAGTTGTTPVTVSQDVTGRTVVRVSPPAAGGADRLFDLNGVVVV